jgi:hypothetical protein
MTVPLALRLPKICDGLAPPISLKHHGIRRGLDERGGFARLDVEAAPIQKRGLAGGDVELRAVLQSGG